MSPPDVSVITPTTGRLPFLRRAIASVLAQDATNLELIVVDDGWGGEVEGALAESGDPRIRVVRTGPFSGAAAARNAGIAAAEGSWIAFLDDDDIWAPGKLAKQLAAASQDGASFSYTATVIVDHALVPIRFSTAPAEVGLATSLRISNAIGSPSSVMIRADMLREAGAFDPGLSTFADWDLWLRLESSVAAIALPEVLVAYTRHGANMHLTTSFRTLLRELRTLARKHAAQAPERPRITPLATLQWLAESYWTTGRPLRGAGIYCWTALRYSHPPLSRTTVRGALRRLRGSESRGDRPQPPAWLGPYAENAYPRLGESAAR